jgi:phenylacetate-CoA ligase
LRSLVDFDRLRHSAHAIHLFRDLMAALRLSPADLAHLRSRRLTATIHHAYTTVPYYRRLFDRVGVRPGDIRTEEDLVRIPISSKEDLRVLPRDEIVSSTAPRDRLNAYTTSGSTGVPFTYYRTIDDQLLFLMSVYRSMVHLGLRWTDRLLSIGDVFYLRATVFQRVGLLPTQVLNPLESLDRQIDVVQGFRPTAMVIHPSAARVLALAVLERRIPVSPMRLIFTSSELLDEATADLIRDAFGTSPHSVYGLFETGRVGWQCRPGGPHHLAEDIFVVETVDPDGRVQDGETGEVILTTLTYRDMPFIRYRTGDLAKRVPRNCSCMHSFSQIRLAGGRTSELLVLADGTLRPPLFLTSYIHRIPGIVQYQLRQEDLDKVTIQIVTDAGFDEGRVSRLRHELSTILPGVQISIERVPEIPRTAGGKHRYAIISPEVKARIPTRPASGVRAPEPPSAFPKP